jgi:hypothetical protein
LAAPIASGAGICRAAVEEIAMPSEAVPGDTAEAARGAAAVEGPPAWDPEREGSVVAEEASEAAEADAGS